MRFAYSLLMLGLALAPGVSAGGKEAPKPNVIVIVADDLGYGELGCYGGKEISTPNIDSLAKNGVRCTNGYVSCPVCSPTRAGLITGRYQQRFGHEFNPGPAPNNEFGLPVSEKTIADRLKAAGYATGMVGKWHLGFEDKFLPTRRGFDEYFGFLGGAHPYTNSPATAPRKTAILRGEQVVGETEYLTDAFAREAVAFIDRHQKSPFFLYLTFNAVHAPLQATAKYLDRFVNIQDEKRRNFAAMLSAMDDGVGKVLDKLRGAGIDRDTLVFFISDNGGPTPQTTSQNGPLNSFKGAVLEGGIRVPFLVQWPSRLPAGKTYDQPVIALDILPTAVAAGGAKITPGDKIDGVNLTPHLSGQDAQPPHETLFWRFGRQSAVRKGNWKLVKMLNNTGLFDLAADVGEKQDLKAQKPEVVKDLEAALKAWDSQLAEPLWNAAAGRARRR